MSRIQPGLRAQLSAFASRVCPRQAAVTAGLNRGRLAWLKAPCRAAQGASASFRDRRTRCEDPKPAPHAAACFPFSEVFPGLLTFFPCCARNPLTFIRVWHVAEQNAGPFPGRRWI